MRPPPTIVVSGFEPFGDAVENPTLLVCERLAGDPRVAVRTVRLPVERARLTDLVMRVLDAEAPDLWIGLGLAMGSASVAVERIAVNLLDFGIPDNAGAQPRDEPIFAEGPAAYKATLSVRPIVDALRMGGIPARVSNSASTYLCNQLMYTVLHMTERRGLATRAGFLHVPAHPALAAMQKETRAETPSMGIDLMAEAVRIAVRVALAEAPTIGVSE